MQTTVIDLLGAPRDWPPLFPHDIERIKGVIKTMRDINLSDAEAQSFWEEYSDPDGWVDCELVSVSEIIEAWDRIIGGMVRQD